MEAHEELLLLRALLRASDYGVLLTDIGRKDLLCNRRFSELFGISVTRTVASPPDQVRAWVLPRLKDPEEFLRTLDAAYADPTLACEDEIELNAPRPRLLRRSTSPVLDPQGNIIGRLWTFLDVTRTRRLERRVIAQRARLQEQSRQLAAALRSVSGQLTQAETALTQTQQQLLERETLSAVGLLAASVAHDIRNILTPLAIEATLADHDDAGLRRDALQNINSQVDRLALLTHQLLSLSRPSAPVRGPVDIAALLGRAATLFAGQARRACVTLTVQASRRLPPVLGDAAQLDQVLVNLMLNAIQAMEGRGGCLTLDAKKRDGGIRVRVADTGPGLPPGVRRRLFSPFFTTRPDGVGLGLYTCRRIVEEHGGTLKAASGAGEGTTITLWLPGAEGGEDAGTPAAGG